MCKKTKIRYKPTKKLYFRVTSLTLQQKKSYFKKILFMLKVAGLFFYNLSQFL